MWFCKIDLVCLYVDVQRKMSLYTCDVDSKYVK